LFKIAINYACPNNKRLKIIEEEEESAKNAFEILFQASKEKSMVEKEKKQ